MVDTLELPDDDDTPEKDSPAVDIALVDPDGKPLVLSLPGEFAHRIISEATLRDPARQHEVVDLLHAHLEDPSIMSLFGGYRGDLLHVTQEYFSKMNLTSEERGGLKYHVFSSSSSYWECAIDSSKTDPFPFLLYELLSIVLRAAQLRRIPQHTAEHTEHRQFLHELKCFFVFTVEHMKDCGLLRTESLRESFEDALLPLLRIHTSLQPEISAFLSEEGWENMLEEGERIYEEEGEKFYADSLRIEEQYRDPVTAILENQKKQQEILLGVASLENAINPQSPEEEQAWFHPTHHLLASVQDSIIIAYKENFSFTKAELGKGHTFMLDFLEGAAGKGFIQWNFAEAEDYVDHIYDWMKTSKKECSFQSLCALVQEYLALEHTNPLSLRAYLGILDGEEPPNVTGQMTFLERLREKKDRAHASISFRFWGHDYSVQEQSDQPPQERRIIVGGYPNIPDNAFVIEHRPAHSEYRFEKLYAFAALAHAAFRVGEKRGWGEYETSALPCEGNKRLLEAWSETGEDFLLFSTTTSHFRKASGKMIDYFVYTSDESDEEQEEENPVDIDETQLVGGPVAS